MVRFFCSVILIALLGSCQLENKKAVIPVARKQHRMNEQVIIDCNYTFNEAIAGTRAPESTVRQLELINVRYYSLDGKIHQGQILTNKKMGRNVKLMFYLIRKFRFPVAHAIPMVKYHWDDRLSMEANNTYSFCYRDTAYSKHARGMAIDINPFFNPVRWRRRGFRNNQPKGAKYQPDKAGTFYSTLPVLKEFEKAGLKWGHNFSRKYDDHHFEM